MATESIPYEIALLKTEGVELEKSDDAELLL